MNQRSFTGIIVLAGLVAAILYLWQPWRPADDPNLRLGLDLQGGLRVVLQAEGGTPSPEDLNAARRIIDNRVNAFGVAEPIIQTSGNNRIVVELPGLSSEDQERAQDLIGQQAVLEFQLVRPAAAQTPDQQLTPANLEEPAFTGEVIQNAQAVFGQFGQAEVSFSIRGADAGAFGRFTANNVNRRMAIVLDGTVISAPNISSRIDSEGRISGNFTLDEASDLALVLRSGSLPISFTTEEIRAIGPTLGADAIASGTRAALIGGVAVVVAILAYYGPLFGGVLTLGLAYVVLAIFGALAGLGAVLTLPGLAGLVLTIGAAVDGNVISFERVKEEMRAGKSLRLAMKSGFSHSLSAIIDANVTTLLAAGALYQYTSGPVRGFAITLAIGIVASVFVNTVVVPFVLDVLTLRFKRPLMPKGVRVDGVAFIKKAPVVMSISGVLALGALLLVTFSTLNLSTDFTGGTFALYQVPEETSVNDVRSAINELDGVSGAGATVQELQDTDAGRQVSVRVGTGAGDGFANQLAQALNGELLQTDFVGPAIGEDLRTGAIYAVLVAFVMILVYVGWRFWPNWVVAIAAVIAVIHDVVIVTGVLSLSGTEFGIPVLAALLFVVGYSLNDSIIIADRIRENLRKERNADYTRVVDMSINQTLARTIMTSFTTLLPVLALLIFGGSVLRGFSLTLLIGIGVGTYSSVFILAPTIVWFQGRRRVLQQRRVRRRVA